MSMGLLRAGGARLADERVGAERRLERGAAKRRGCGRGQRNKQLTNPPTDIINTCLQNWVVFT